MSTYEEVQPLVTRPAFLMLAAMLAATSVFIGVCVIAGIVTEAAMFYVSTAVFIAMVLAFRLVRLRIRVDGDALTLRFVREHVIPLEDVIDYKLGDIDIIRNYSGLGAKNMKYKHYICHGYERGISFKLTGRTVVTLSSADPEAVGRIVVANRDAKAGASDE